MEKPSSVIRDGMRIDWDVPIEMDDGVVLRADVYRPPEEGEYPVIMSHGPYAKWLGFQQLYESQWEQMAERHPDVTAESTNRYQNWETVDPEKWATDGYAVVRVDCRGSGRSPGYLDIWSPRETQDYANCVEWAAEQPWSNGKVGLNGISYYAMNQWQVAALQPDGLEAMCVWEGSADLYRDFTHHGGIYCTFTKRWYPNQVESVQHGKGTNGYRSPMTGGWVSGPETLTEEELGANRSDPDAEMVSRKLVTDDWWQERIPDLDDVEVPLLSAGNWGIHGLLFRGNTEGFMRAASEQKWLEIHGGAHWTEFYTDYGRGLQKRFFGHFLKDEDTGWDEQPPVQLQVRRPDEQFEQRHEEDWPIPRTEFTPYYLHPDESRLSTDPQETVSSATYDALGEGLTFTTPPIGESTEVTGPISAKLFVSSDTEDADLFLVVRAFKPDMEEIVFRGAVDPHKPLALGWLRASHRKLDPEMSTEWRPYHTHDERQPLTPGEVYELDIEVRATSIVAPPGSRLALSVRGRDYRYPGGEGAELKSHAGRFTGVGPMRHDDARDRPPEIYGGDVTVHAGPDMPSHVLLPIVPERE